MSKIIAINETQATAVAKVSGVDKKIKIRAVEHKEGGCDNCIFYENYSCTIKPTEPSYCTPTRTDKKTVIWVEDKGEENEVLTNKTNIKMKATPKYNVGEIAIIRTKEEYRIGKIASISIQGDKIYYYFENIAGKYPEDVVSSYGNNEEKTEVSEVSEEPKTTISELPKTYEEAIKFFLKKDKILYYRNNYQSLTSCYVSDIRHIDNDNYSFSLSRETCRKLIQFEKLIFLRDIYRQGWEPDLTKSVTIHTIICYLNCVTKSFTSTSNRVLSFQSEEIRDEFYNNFKDLIEECKEFI